jgi:hypothetical protein
MTDKIHIYEIEPRQETDTGGYKTAGMTQVAKGKRPEHLERSAIYDAQTFLAEHPEVTSVGVYHTYPSPGPVRRFVREIKQS